MNKETLILLEDAGITATATSICDDARLIEMFCVYPDGTHDSMISVNGRYTVEQLGAVILVVSDMIKRTKP